MDHLIGQRIVIFENHKSQIIEGRESLELEDVLSMEASLMHLALTCYPEQIEYIDKVCFEVFNFEIAL